MSTKSNHGNNGSNNKSDEPELRPTDDELLRLKEEHKLSWHPKGGWCRVFPGDRNRSYFGKVPSAVAVKKMHAAEERRKKGEPKEIRHDNLLMKDAVNLFLSHLDSELAKGDIQAAQRASYGDEIDKFIHHVGPRRRLTDLCRPDAPEVIFAPLRAAAVKRGVFAAEKHVTQVRTFLRWCSTVRRLMAAPFFADAFSAPSKKEKRAKTKSERREKGTATWTPAEVREIVEAAKGDVHRYAQVLLMLNGGMGAADLSNLDDAEINWDTRCIDTDRSKTLVPRIVPLWDITVAAMKASRAARSLPADPAYATRFFLTPHGRPLVVEELVEEKRVGTALKMRQSVKRTDSLKNWFYQLVNGSERLKWKKKVVRLPHLKRHRGGVYSLRAVFAGLATGHGQDRNLDAIILGQTFDREILEHYLRGDLETKLRAIVEHVRTQLWPTATKV